MNFKGYCYTHARDESPAQFSPVASPWDLNGKYSWCALKGQVKNEQFLFD